MLTTKLRALKSLAVHLYYVYIDAYISYYGCIAYYLCNKVFGICTFTYPQYFCFPLVATIKFFDFSNFYKTDVVL